MTLKKVEEYQKSCSIVMSDSTKKALFNSSNSNNTLRITVCAKFTYLEKLSNSNSAKFPISSISSVTKEKSKKYLKYF
ncbi:MAG: hypothetical protein MJ252_22635 [archaeon]|nr:hypothetical protein [archaeon]